MIISNFIKHSPKWKLFGMVGVCLIARSGSASAQSENLALTATASASHEYYGGGFEASRANDGEMATRWNDDMKSGNDIWIEYDWKTPQTFNEVIIYQAFDRIDGFHIQTFDAVKDAWVNVFSGFGQASGRIDIDKTLVALMNPPVTADKMRLRIDGLSGYGEATLWEMEVRDVKIGTIAGRILDEAGQPIPFATVSAGAVSSTTGYDGAYSLVVDAGEAEVMVKTDDLTYEPRTVRGIVVGDGATIHRDITLFKSPTDLAKGADVIVSSVVTDDPEGDFAGSGKMLVDGRPLTYWQSSEGEGATFGVSLPSPQTFNQVMIYERGDIIGKLALQTCDDARGAWSDLQMKTFMAGRGGDPVLKFSFAQPVTARQIRAVVPTGGIAISPQFDAVSIYEFAVRNAPIGTLSVTVQDYSTKKPIPNATVVTDDGNALGVTDASGVLSALIDADDYRISATADGYFEGPEAFATVNAGATASATISLPSMGENLALKAKASASSEDADAAVSQANDDDPATYWESAGTEDGYLGGIRMNAWIRLDWPSAVTFNRVVIDEFGDRSREIKVQALDPATGAWTDVGASASPGGGKDVEIEHVVDLKNPVTAAQVRICVPTGENRPRFREARVYSFAPIPATPANPGAIRGDLNGDGEITVSDAVLSLRIAVGILTPTDAQRTAGDANEDGETNIQDAALILQATTGLKTGL